MRSRAKFLLIILSVSLNIAFIAVWGTKTLTQTASAAKSEVRQCNPDSCGIWCPLHRALGTTASQWQTLEPLQREFQTASGAMAQVVDSLRTQLTILMAKPDPDQTAIDAKQEEILGVQRHMQSLVVKHLLDEKQILTAEQQTKLFAMMRDNGCSRYGGMMGMKHGNEKCSQNKIQDSSK